MKKIVPWTVDECEKLLSLIKDVSDRRLIMLKMTEWGVKNNSPSRSPKAIDEKITEVEKGSDILSIARRKPLKDHDSVIIEAIERGMEKTELYGMFTNIKDYSLWSRIRYLKRKGYLGDKDIKVYKAPNPYSLKNKSGILSKDEIIESQQRKISILEGFLKPYRPCHDIV